jgi:hypothetical protein
MQTVPRTQRGAESGKLQILRAEGCRPERALKSCSLTFRPGARLDDQVGIVDQGEGAGAEGARRDVNESAAL